MPMSLIDLKSICGDRSCGARHMAKRLLWRAPILRSIRCTGRYSSMVKFSEHPPFRPPLEVYGSVLLFWELPQRTCEVPII